MSSHVFHEIYLHINWHANEWQRGFGVVSFGKRQLPWVLDYIAKQKEHHAKGTTKRRLELIGFDDDGSPLTST